MLDEEERVVQEFRNRVAKVTRKLPPLPPLIRDFGASCQVAVMFALWCSAAGKAHSSEYETLVSELGRAGAVRYLLQEAWLYAADDYDSAGGYYDADDAVACMDLEDALFQEWYTDGPASVLGDVACRALGTLVGLFNESFGYLTPLEGGFRDKILIALADDVPDLCAWCEDDGMDTRAETRRGHREPVPLCTPHACEYDEYNNDTPNGNYSDED